MESTSYAPTIGRNEKLCFDCKTSKTPLWRSGPAGPKSLCNACGIRFRKKKSTVGSDKRKLSSSSTTDDHTSCSRKREIGEEFSMKKGDLMKKLRINVVGMGKEHRSPMKLKRVDQEEYRNRNKMKFGEVEEAAYLLMCLSCG